MTDGQNPSRSPNPGPAASGHGFGTAPVFLASISTILGAILFLRFGYAVGHVGLAGTLLIIGVAHLVTIPTVLAVSEIATNRRVAGGGAYYIISRSFGTRIGGVIGIALYLSQAISVAFYLVAFAEVFGPVSAWIESAWSIAVDPRFVSLPATLVVVALVLTKGADLGVRVLWVVCLTLGGSITAFLLVAPSGAGRGRTRRRGGRRRSTPRRAFVPFQSRHLRRRVRRHPTGVRRRQPGVAGALQLQRKGFLPGMQRSGLPAGRAVVPRRRAPGLQGL